MKSFSFRTMAVSVLSLILTSSVLTVALDGHEAGATSVDNTLSIASSPFAEGGATNLYVITMDATPATYGLPAGSALVYDVTQNQYLCSASIWVEAGGDSSGGEYYKTSCVSSGIENTGDQIRAQYMTTGPGDYDNSLASTLTVVAPPTAISNIPSSAVVGGSFTPQFAGSVLDSGSESVTPQVCSVDASGIVHYLSAGTCTLRATGVQPLPTTHPSPSGVAVDQVGDVFEIDGGTQTGGVGNSDGGGSGYTIADRQINLIGSVPGGNPSSISADPSGNIFVADNLNGQLYEDTLAQLSDGVPPQPSTSFTGISALTTDSQGSVYVAGQNLAGNGPGIYEFINQGSGQYGNNGIGFAGNPNGIVVDSNGNIYISDASTSSVVQLAPQQGFYSQSTFYSDYAPSAIAVDSNNNVLVTSPQTSMIAEVTPVQVGSPIVSYINAGLDDPRGIAVDPNGDIYVVNGNANADPYLALVMPFAEQSFSVTGDNASMSLNFTIPAAGGTVSLPLGGDTTAATVTCGIGGTYDPTGFTCTYPATSGATSVTETVVDTLTTGMTFGNGFSSWPGVTYLTSVSSWAGYWTSFSGAFNGASALTALPSTLPATVTSLSSALSDASSFNQDVSGWDTSNVTNMMHLFYSAYSFNNGGVPLATTPGGWNTSNVTNFDGMFNFDLSFNQDVSSWNTSRAQVMSSMFYGAYSFNNGGVPLATTPGGWNTSNVTNFSFMFGYALAFSQDISSWNFSSANTLAGFISSTLFTEQDYNNLLTSLGSQASTSGLQHYVDFGVDVQYSESAQAAKLSLLDLSWNITDGGVDPATLVGTSASMTLNYTIPASGDSVSLPLNSDDVMATVTCGAGGVFSWPGFTCTYPATSSPTNVTEVVSDPATTGIGFGNGTSTSSGIQDLVSVSAWSGNWTSFATAFYGASNLQTVPTSLPSSVTDLTGMFFGATTFNQDISAWDTSNVTSMSNMFNSATSFNQDISAWDTVKVTDMSGMFFGATAFNNAGADLAPVNGSWNTSKVSNMSYMFAGDTSFDQNVSLWTTSSVSTMAGMFQGATSFNQDLSSWNFSMVQDMSSMLVQSGISEANYDNLLAGLDPAAMQSALQLNVPFDASAMYSVADYQFIEDLAVNGWQVTNGGPDNGQQVSTPAAMSLSFVIPATGDTLALPISGDTSALNVSCGGGGSFDSTSNTCAYGASGSPTTVTVDISMSSTAGAAFGNGSNTWEGASDLVAVNSWSGNWTSLSGAFNGAVNLTSVPTDLPSAVKDLSFAFQNATSFNQDISTWGTAAVTSMADMFYDASSFNNGGVVFASSAGQWDTRGVTDLSYMFEYDTAFNQDISSWNTSSVTTMAGMFRAATTYNNGGVGFNSVTANWSTLNVMNMSQMFLGDPVFNQDISSWNTSQVTDMSTMFEYDTAFNNDGQPLSTTHGGWNTNRVQTFAGMFQGASAFNQDVSTWDTSQAQSMANMFANDRFNNDGQPLPTTHGGWNTSSVEGMPGMFFRDPVFNQDISSWDTSSLMTAQGMFNGATSFNNGGAPFASVTGGWDMQNLEFAGYMFANATSFNQDISSWNTSVVIDMSAMFENASAFNNGNQPMTSTSGGWSTTNAQSMNSMFAGATSFNQDISSWNTTNVNDMGDMFNGATAFNNGGAPLASVSGEWDTSSVHSFQSMFANATSFNQDISSWNTSVVTDMSAMFASSNFNNGGAPLATGSGAWDTSRVSTMNIMFYGDASFNQDVSSWNTSNVHDMTGMFAGDTAFNNGSAPLTTTQSGWNTSNVGSMQAMFYDTIFNHDISSWNTSQVTDMSYMFEADAVFNNGRSRLETTPGGWNTGNVTTMLDMFFEASSFNRSISTWDTSKVTDMSGMFSFAFSFDNYHGSLATKSGGWNTSRVTDMSNMFYEANAFDQDISTWDTSSVTNMSGMFVNATSFDNGEVPLASSQGGWNTSLVTDMSLMFDSATAFDQDITTWDTSSVTNMSGMFSFATSFDNGENPMVSSQGGWNTSLVTDMSNMFEYASNFDQDLSSWDFSHVTTMASMFINSGLTDPNYTNLLNALYNDVEAGTTPLNVQLDSTAGYRPSAIAARLYLVAHGWQITDNGVQGPFTMPDLSGLTLSDAETALVDAGFSSTPIETSVTGGATPANNGHIASQSIDAGTVVSDGTTVVSLSYFRYVAPVNTVVYVMPNLQGLTVDQAVAALNAAGFSQSPTATASQSGATKLNDATVFSQSIAAGRVFLSPGINIGISFYDYVPATFAVPNLQGLTVDQAVAALSAAGFSTSPVETAVTNGATAMNDGHVISQSVAAGSVETDPTTQVNFGYYKFVGAAPTKTIALSCVFTNHSSTLSAGCIQKLSSIVTQLKKTKSVTTVLVVSSPPVRGSAVSKQADAVRSELNKLFGLAHITTETFRIVVTTAHGVSGFTLYATVKI